MPAFTLEHRFNGQIYQRDDLLLPAFRQSWNQQMDGKAGNHDAGGSHGNQLTYAVGKKFQQLVFPASQQIFCAIRNGGIRKQNHRWRILVGAPDGFLVDGVHKFSRGERSHAAQDAPDFLPVCVLHAIAQICRPRSRARISYLTFTHSLRCGLEESRQLRWLRHQARSSTCAKTLLLLFHLIPGLKSGTSTRP